MWRDAWILSRVLDSSLISWHRHFRRRILATWAGYRIRSVKEADDAQRIAYLRRLDPFVFEELVLDAFQRQGAVVLRSLRYSGDGGLDGRVYFRGEWYGLQCKRYKGDIPLRFLLDFRRSLTRAGLRRGFFVSTSNLSATAWQHFPDGVSSLSPTRFLELFRS
ncbi:restriction endonuclease [Acidithiobacillus caldus]|uniref:restriction endonuclease n=1 Tax=Acidithiobacillus caldus TaxID=33059 RepID=UPI001C0681B9|nr:restriction endonuclease [Acidithiobacillus caldus]MBU2820935.1 restriction endonuclease [Acidithiobacillus caldus]